MLSILLFHMCNILQEENGVSQKTAEETTAIVKRWRGNV